MADLFSCSGLNAFFSNRFRKYQVFIEVTNDLQTLQLILSFLDLRDLLAFLSTSSHFRSMQQIQSVQVRLLRAKIQYYERPKPILAYSGMLLTHFYKLPVDTSQVQTKMVKSHNELVKFNQEIRFFKYLKREGLVKNQESFNNMLEKKGFAEFGKFYEEFHKEDAKLGMGSLEGKLKEHKWSDLQQKEMEYFKQYKDYLESKEAKKPAAQIKAGKKLVEYRGTATGLNPIEYLDARRDYQLRKAAKQVQIVTMQKTRELAQMDPCSKQVFQKLNEANKAKMQEQNVAKLRMAPVTKLKQVDLQLIVNSRDVKVIKQSLAGKMFTGLKDMIFSRFPSST